MFCIDVGIGIKFANFEPKLKKNNNVANDIFIQNRSIATGS